jgi:hypothetical protein
VNWTVRGAGPEEISLLKPATGCWADWDSVVVVGVINVVGIAVVAVVFTVVTGIVVAVV